MSQNIKDAILHFAGFILLTGLGAAAMFLASYRL